MMDVRVLSADDIRSAISMAEAIEAVADGFAQLSSGSALVPLRTSLGSAGGTSLFMPAYLPSSETTALKIVSVCPDNPLQGLPTIIAIVAVLDGRTGIPLALMDGTYLTALRTGAASGAATDLLATEDAKVLALFGAGVQGRTQLEAVCTVRAIEEVRVFDPDVRASRRLVTEIAGQGGVSTNVLLADSPRKAVENAEIVVTATTSQQPVFEGADIGPGTHINAIGAYTPEMRELDETIVSRAKIVVDTREGCLAEAGDLIMPIQSGAISPADIYAELGEIVRGAKAGRESEEEITLYKSVGTAVQDAAVARAALDRAEQLDLGTVVTL
jgi:alanine dehydrogenase